MAPKRKRAGPASDEPAPDASSDGAADTPQAAEAEVKPLDPPAKRTRSAKIEATNGGEQEQPRGRARAGSKVEMPANGAEEGAGENGEAGTMRMAPPPPAGSVDPKGYKTNPPPQGRSVRVYADGVFDMFHLGHMRVLQQAKTAFPDTYLIVGVTGEAETHKRKGLTVMSAKERAESLRHCRWVDEVIEDCPWIINMAFLEKNHIDYVAHDDEPYGASEGDDIYKPIKERGMFLVTQRTEGVSTTGIITKIVRDYEQYVSRQLKRGTKRQELNISWLKKNELDIKRNVAELRDTIRQNWTTTGQEVSRELRQFWQPSRPNSPAASLRNGTPGRASSTLSPPSLLLDPATINGTPQRDGKGADFMAGYAMGLVGSVKGWMEASRRRNLSDSRPESPNGSESEDSGNKSPVGEIGSSRRGRQGQMEKEKEKDGASVQLEEEMET
ncbi:choline-phosphate cytidylyltransferase [Friedmanniomyces endolithicus]|nr:choline-phosphate cytidylyltransferase [Friedmanniomyces endolithicus]